MVGGNFSARPVLKQPRKSFAQNEIDFHLGLVEESIGWIVRQNFKPRVDQQPDRLRVRPH